MLYSDAVFMYRICYDVRKPVMSSAPPFPSANSFGGKKNKKPRQFSDMRLKAWMKFLCKNIPFECLRINPREKPLTFNCLDSFLRLGQIQLHCTLYKFDYKEMKFSIEAENANSRVRC